MFPKTFGAVAIIVGAIWIIQGSGVAPTGSFMDDNPLWTVLGALLALAGAVSMFVQRRRNGSGRSDQPGS